MEKKNSYGRTYYPEYDPAFCMIVKLLDTECPLQPCVGCYLRSRCLEWFDKLCTKSARMPLDDHYVDCVKSLLPYLETVEKVRKMGLNPGNPFA